MLGANFWRLSQSFILGVIGEALPGFPDFDRERPGRPRRPECELPVLPPPFGSSVSSLFGVFVLPALSFLLTFCFTFRSNLMSGSGEGFRHHDEDAVSVTRGEQDSQPRERFDFAW